ncbi:MAG: sodium:proline symporter [Pseudomonadota bacterium]
MEFLGEPWALVAFVGLIVVASLALAPRNVTSDAFFDGTTNAGDQPGLWTLVLSQVTTWIFARSLMNAAILGYFYGFAGTLAYTAYYLSFLTGLVWVSHMRKDYAGSVQDWIGDRFGVPGNVTYNLVIALRLLSEVFANLIVVGLIFSAAFPEVDGAGTISVVALAVVGLMYSAMGGLRASLRTDVMQMIVFLGVFAVALFVLVTSDGFSLPAIFAADGVHDQGARPGWILFVVALLQVISYPVHDPVMMDRGFIADERTTRASFFHAFWISSLCIFGFGMFGIQAALVGASYENQLLGTWEVMFGPVVYFLIAASLLVSALSTLDSALSSASRLMIEEFDIAERTVANGRWVMVAFMVLGGLLTLWENQTLFDAVAVSGTASMFLAPVLVLSLVAGRAVPLWSYLAAWLAAVLGAATYMYRDTDFVSAYIDGPHKYDELLVICVGVLIIGFAAGLVGLMTQRRKATVYRT